MLAIGTDMFPKQILDHDLRLFLHIYSTLEDDFPELLFKCVNLFDGRKFKLAFFMRIPFCYEMTLAFWFPESCFREELDTGETLS
jgi:hypothetical protein